MKAEQKPRVRLSGIDLLRIIAMLLICVFHATQTCNSMIDCTAYGFAANAFLYVLLQLGGIGNMLFAACSAFFLVDSGRSRLQKAINILLDSMLISIGIFLITLFKQYPLTGEQVLSQFIPDVFGNVWFVQCYVIFYLLSPVVILGLKHVGRKMHMGILVGTFLTYGVFKWIGFPLIGSELLMFFFLLTLVAFAKWHLPNLVASKKANVILAVGGFLISFGVYFLARIISRYWEPLYGRFAVGIWYQPFIAFAILGTVNLFGTMKFHNRFISYLGTLTLFVYVIHENMLLRQFVRVEFYQYVFATFGEQTFPLWIFVCGIGMFVGAFILAAIYNETFHRLTAFLAKKINQGITFCFDRLYQKVFPNGEAQ